MNIVCVGGGPAGLYFAILMKLAGSEHEVTVLERKPAGSRDGWGVVFWDDLLSDLRATDPESATRISEGAFQWHGQVLALRGAPLQIDGTGYSIGRSRLLDILGARATELGVRTEFGHDVESAAAFTDADVVVAADGANSALRRLEPARFMTNVTTGRNKYLWLGTAKVFDSFTFAYVNTPAGWVWCHAYAFDEHTSTFIVECAPETWTGLGLDSLGARDGIARLEQIFEHQLDGASLESLSRSDATLPWLNFRTVTNECWHSGNTVLMGDAAHTTHFTIGSGTRLAMEDAIALAAALRTQATPQLAFANYEAKRRAELVVPQTEARFSAQWFESVNRYIDLPNPAFLRLMNARRDPLMARVPPKLYYQLRRLRSWIGPRARALLRRHP